MYSQQQIIQLLSLLLQNKQYPFAIDVSTQLLGGFWGGHFGRQLRRYLQGDFRQLPPSFAGETTPSIKPLATQLLPSFRAALGQPTAASSQQKFSKALQSIGLNGCLLLLGQRQTSASLANKKAFPPSYTQLLTASKRKHHPKQQLSVAARAWAKHAARSKASWWGQVMGNPAVQNQHAQKLIQTILTQLSWWNVFGHYRKDIVFEARIRAGYGARWGNRGQTFIGFLEPFDSSLGALGDRRT